MSLFKTDPLLAVCRLFSWFILIFMAGSAVFALGAAVAALAAPEALVKALRQSYPQLHDDGLRPAFFLSMALIAVASALMARFMLHLLGIIRSVPAGDAFTLANAGRLRAMAWIALASMPLGFLLNGALGRVVALIGPRAEEAGITIRTLGGGFSNSQILITLLLFVLARLFAQGAAMRDEIEGTV